MEPIEYEIPPEVQVVLDKFKGEQSKPRRWDPKTGKLLRFRQRYPALYDKKAIAELRNALIARYGRKCMKCKGTEEIGIDHIVSRCKGGTNDIENLQLLCRDCNFRKGLAVVDYRLGSEPSM